MLRATLTTLRKATGLTQAELAKRARITGAYLSMLESGIRRSPSLAVLQRLARALGVPLGELVTPSARGSKGKGG